MLLRYRKAVPRDRVSLCTICTTGVKPGLSFGDTVVGMTDAELKSARSVMLSFQAPRHAGVSCRAKTALVGYPMWRSMVAPAIAWAQAVWSSITKPEFATFSVKQLCSMWRAVDTEGRSWGKSKGPTSRMHLSLQRIGWRSSSPLDWFDDKGAEISLIYTTPPWRPT